LAGYVVAKWGESTAFFINAFTFVGMIVALLTIQLPRRLIPEDGAVGRGGIREGMAYVRSDRPTLSMLALMASSTVFVFPVLVVMLPLYARHLLGLEADRMGWLMGLTALGSFAGAIGLLAVPRHYRRRVFLGTVLGVATGLWGLSLAPTFGWAVPALILVALGVSILVGLAHTVVQERAPGELRGRVSAIAGLSFFGLMPFASLGLTSIADLLGMRSSLALGAVAFALIGVPIVLSRSAHYWEVPVEVPQAEVPAPSPHSPPTESW
jgi:MFS family permease